MKIMKRIKILVLMTATAILIACGGVEDITTSTPPADTPPADTPPADTPPADTPPAEPNLYAWGLNDNGQLGNDSTTDLHVPLGIIEGEILDISAGLDHAAAIGSDGKLFTWGNNAKGQLGNNSTTASKVPVKIGDKTWKSVSTGVRTTAAIDSDGKLYAWGNNEYGQLGNNSTTTSKVLVKIGDKTWNQVSVGSDFIIAIDTTKKLYAWGNNYRGQLANGNHGTTHSSSVPVKRGDKNWMQVSAGYYHAVAIDDAKKLYTWGWNVFGQLGNGSVGNIQDSVDTPTKIGDKTWKQVSAGAYYTIAIDNADKLYAWGRNNYGQIGNGSGGSDGNDISDAPVAIGITGEPNKTWTQVSGGVYHTVAIDSTGSLYAWGSNEFGQLGNNSTTDSNVPVKIGTSKWDSVDAGEEFTIAIIK